jgi:YD repeat-containing protein
LVVDNDSLSGDDAIVSHTVTPSDTLTTIAAALASAVNASTALQAANVSATSSGAVLNVAIAPTTYTQSTSGGATETISFGSNNGGNIYATIGGKPTTGDTLTITTHNGALTGGSEANTYTVLSTDTLVTIAAGLAALMNADAKLQALGVTASNSNAAALAFTQSFSGNGTLPAAASTANVSGVDGGSNTKTNGLQLNVANGTTASLTYDLNGNMTSDGTNSYSWDAENRATKIVYPGSGNTSQFAYDALGRNVSIVETVSGSVTSTKPFVWAGVNLMAPVEINSQSPIPALRRHFT